MPPRPSARPWKPTSRPTTTSRPRRWEADHDAHRHPADPGGQRARQRRGLHQLRHLHRGQDLGAREPQDDPQSHGGDHRRDVEQAPAQGQEAHRQDAAA